jgi:hypothetical protein
MVLESRVKSELNRMIDQFFMERKFWPYCLQRRDDGKYVLLNRFYKPVGYIEEDGSAEYETWPIAFELEISPEQVAAMSHNGEANTMRIYFYAGSCAPWVSAKYRKAYFRRLAMFFLLVGAPECRDTRMPSPWVTDYFRNGDAREPVTPQSQT